MDRIRLMCVLVLVVPAVSLAAETHEKVQAALDYSIPFNSCKKPRSIVITANIIDSDGDGGVEQSDVDSYTINRLKRKEKRWQNCVTEYKKELLKDLAELRNCAQYGLTQEQANIILEKMADIQAVVMTVDGTKPGDPDESHVHE